MWTAKYCSILISTTLQEIVGIFCHVVAETHAKSFAVKELFLLILFIKFWKAYE